MSRARSLFSFVNRFVGLAGRSCCSGRSWAALDRSLEQRAGELPRRRSPERDRAQLTARR
ncbi:MAG: hypothetical protein ACRDL5_05190 [Solirubrobacteraceae bacterium]